MRAPYFGDARIFLDDRFPGDVAERAPTVAVRAWTTGRLLPYRDAARAPRAGLVGLRVWLRRAPSPPRARVRSRERVSVRRGDDGAAAGSRVARVGLRDLRRLRAAVQRRATALLTWSRELSERVAEHLDRRDRRARDCGDRSPLPRRCARARDGSSHALRCDGLRGRCRVRAPVRKLSVRLG